MAVALDEIEAARPWVEAAGATFTAVADPHHVVADLYELFNVPTVVWVDADDRIARPPNVAFGDNSFQEFTGVDAEVHKSELKRWVVDDEIAYDDRFVIEHRLDVGPDEILARLERRVGAWLWRNGDEVAASQHFDQAAQLAPMDWTVRRGSMPMRGVDSFGAEFFAFMQEWTDAGKPGYGWEA